MDSITVGTLAVDLHALLQRSLRQPDVSRWERGNRLSPQCRRCNPLDPHVAAIPSSPPPNRTCSGRPLSRDFFCAFSTHPCLPHAHRCLATAASVSPGTHQHQRISIPVEMSTPACINDCFRLGIAQIVFSSNLGNATHTAASNPQVSSVHNGAYSKTLNVGRREKRYTQRRGVKYRHLALHSGGYHSSTRLPRSLDPAVANQSLDGALKRSQPRSRQSPAVCVSFRGAPNVQSFAVTLASDSDHLTDNQGRGEPKDTFPLAFPRKKHNGVQIFRFQALTN